MLTCVTDLAFGDTGKGKIVDAITHEYDTLVRFNGGPNAGHTIVVNGEKFSFHNLPSGMFSIHPPKTLVLSGGMVVNPVSLMEEISKFESKITTLLLSKRIHCIMPWHIQEDIAKSQGIIGTTGKGIGPCYADKMNRVRAIRLGTLLTDLQLGDYFEGFEKYLEAAKFLQQFIGDDASFLREKVRNDENVLFESANGIHLDIDHGCYPYVTSSGTGPAYIPQSCGLPNVKLDCIIGITKAYTTRVGEGPLATELFDAIGDSIRKIGNEFGTTTGRPRRVGWLDLDIVREGVQNTGATTIAITHTDTLSKACIENDMTHFKIKNNGQMVEMPIWNDYRDSEFDDFLSYVESSIGVDIGFIGIGRDRRDLLVF
jgi:adenylosuccinate synthase